MAVNRIVLVLALYALVVSPTHAALILNGSFSLTNFSGPISALSGSFAATFDDSVVTGTGIEIFDDAQLLTEVTLSTAIGTTTFTAANSEMWLQFQDGALIDVYVGGAQSGATGTPAFGDDDFRIIWRDRGSGWYVEQGAYHVATNPGLVYTSAIGPGGTLTVTNSGQDGVASSPATILLLALGLAGFRFAAKGRLRKVTE